MKKWIAKILVRIKEKGRYNSLSLMDEYEFRSLEECEGIQKKRLREMLVYCMENVPRYRILSKPIGLNFNDGEAPDRLKKFPILTRESLAKNSDDLKVENFMGDFFRNTSGGSTGEPVAFLQDIKFRESSIASSMLFNRWAGADEGEKLLMLWGSERDILGQGKGLLERVKWYFLNICFLNSFRMSKEDMEDYVKKINRIKPNVITAYVQAMYELAKFIDTKGLKVFNPKGIIVSAGTLYPEMRELIERVFMAKVYNRYGSREVSNIACSCEKAEGLHVNVFNHYIEILNDKMEDCKPSETGKVYVTTLNNFVMPLIRYDIGDFATVAEKRICSCGRGLPLIAGVIGREMSVFRTRQGTIVPAEFFIHFVGVVFNQGFISKFQVIQKDYDDIVVKVVVADGKKFEENRGKIVEAIKSVMGENCSVRFEWVADIPPMASGKYLYTVSEI